MRIIFAGSPPIAAAALGELSSKHSVELVLTMPDAPVGRSKVLQPTAVAVEAERLGLKCLKLRRLDERVVEEIAKAEAELAVVIAFGAMIPNQALELMPWLNIHFSLLPKWRGASPLQYSILSGQGQGVTIFQLDAGMDTGKIISQLPFELDPDATAGELLPQLTNTAVAELLSIMSDLPEAKPQQGDASLAPKLKRADARLSFDDRAGTIHRKVMAFNPEPMAWCEFRDAPLRILRTKSLGDVNWNGLGQSDLTPGQVEQHQGKILVGCGGGTRVELLEVQPAGKNAMGAADWFRGLTGAVQLD